MALRYVEAKLMQEGFMYRNLDFPDQIKSYNFGAHEISVNDKTLFGEFDVLTGTIKPSSMPRSFNGNYNNLDLIVSDLLLLFK